MLMLQSSLYRSQQSSTQSSRVAEVAAYSSTITPCNEITQCPFKPLLLNPLLLLLLLNLLLLLFDPLPLDPLLLDPLLHH